MWNTGSTYNLSSGMAVAGEQGPLGGVSSGAPRPGQTSPQSWSLEALLGSLPHP